MLHLNPLTIPDPAHPEKFDAYGIERPELIVYAVNSASWTLVRPSPKLDGYQAQTIVCAFRGAAISMPADMLGAFLVSVGFRPLGRLEKRERGVKPRPEDFDLAAAVNDLGPRLRALRESTDLRMGELARALRCSPAQLSCVELGEWKPSPPPSQADLELDGALHPAGRCTCGGGGGGDCEWCKMDQERDRVGALEFARRLAGVAVDAYRAAKYEEDELDVVTAALVQHVGPDDREAALVDRLAGAVARALYAEHHPTWPNDGTKHIVMRALTKELLGSEDAELALNLSLTPASE